MALVREWTGREARALRHALRLSTRAFADYLGVSARTISKWESLAEQTSPRPDTQAILDTALSKANPEAKARFRGLVHRLPTDDEVHTEFTAQHTDDDMKRRTLIALAGPAAIGAGPIADKLERARRSLECALGFEPAEQDADDWERIAAEYARRVHLLPPATTLPALAGDFAALRSDISSAPDRVRTRMVHSAAQLAAVTAIVMVILRQHHVAARWWLTAARAATSVGDPRLSALVAGRQAVMSLYDTAPDKVLAMADRAISAGGSRACPGVLNGLSARAQALARLGRDDDALVALNEVGDLFEKLPSHDSTDPGSQWSWPENRLHFIASVVHSRAGRVVAATRAQDAALSSYPVESWSGPAQIEAQRATVLIRSGDVTSGARHLADLVAKLDEWQRADGLVHRTALETLHSIPSAYHDTSAVRETRTLLDVPQ